MEQVGNEQRAPLRKFFMIAICDLTDQIMNE
jgi:hypothetical protein